MVKKIIYKSLYKTGALFSRVHLFFYKLAYKIELPYLPLSELNKVKWIADKKEKTLRYEYDLNAHSIIVDVGGYEGDFASEIFSRYQPTIYVFEPVSNYVQLLNKRFNKNKAIKIVPKGLGAKNEELLISVMDEASSHTRTNYMNKKGIEEKIKIIDINDFMNEHSIEIIDLIKINIEGAEYDLLDRMIEINSLKKFKNLQIQFHDFYPDFQSRYNKIRLELEKSHKITYEYPFVWENWQLKN